MIKTRSLTAKILEILAGSALATLDVMNAVLESGYGVSYSRLERSARNSEARREKFLAEARDRQRFSNLISKLKREGLIGGDRHEWKLTKLGKARLTKIQEIKSRKVDLPILKYEKKLSKDFTLVIFDIPEIYKEKRSWLREVLIALGFKLLQKSVWIGKVVIPEEFMIDIKRLNIVDYVHVFSVLKTGTVTNE
ncbi:MAG: hypothetical protein Q7R86_02575 [bacterium]|nr:hypothetical protein [bacterium]